MAKVPLLSSFSLCALTTNKTCSSLLTEFSAGTNLGLCGCSGNPMPSLLATTGLEGSFLPPPVWSMTPRRPGRITRPSLGLMVVGLCDFVPRSAQREACRGASD
ncbi:hypothetical protein CEXT_179131 [Caerostris extrusa]|uniref:Secreted protein n=1 Tax=Caerostris extrusa TaxID=172846 RepID=A0AAV4QUD3_CAEEX|nr:hypothetical protein CEXT_179131 [Caerostris extrusa]